MYFKRIKSFEDLKAQFKALALKHHPDVGGDIEVMKEINGEYDVLFPIWQKRYNASAAVENTETASSTRSRFYTQHGWEGSNYDWSLSTTEIAKRIRQYVKMAHSDCKFSVTSKYFSGGSSINVALLEAPYPAFNDDANISDGYLQSAKYSFDKGVLTERATEVLKDVQYFMDSYNMKDIDSMIDYFHVNFWDHLDVGKWDRPFKVVERKAKKRSAIKSA